MCIASLCHPEHQRGILHAHLVAGHEQSEQDPSLSLEMTGDALDGGEFQTAQGTGTARNGVRRGAACDAERHAAKGMPRRAAPCVVRAFRAVRDSAPCGISRSLQFAPFGPCAFDGRGAVPTRTTLT